MNNISVVMVGQPNVGKSLLSSTLTGGYLKVANFSGVTVQEQRVFSKEGDLDLEVIDLPGLYSLNTYTPEEETAKKFLLHNEYDIIVNVVNASSLSRNLLLTLQLMDMGKKMILVLNMMDELEQQKTVIDVKALEELLKIPVVAVSSTKKTGVDDLKRAIFQLQHQGKEREFLYYDRRVEETLQKLEEKMSEDKELADRARFYSLRMLEQDKEVYKILHDRPVFLEFLQTFHEQSETLTTLMGEKTSIDVMDEARVSTVRGIIEKIFSKGRDHTLSGKIDRILVHKFWGIPIFLFFIWALFQLTFQIGSYPQDLLGTFFEYLASATQELLPQTTLTQAFTEGVIPGIGAVVSFLPNILILFLGINILEQTGYMARAAFLLDGTMKRFGLHGKAFIPMINGFGCSVPAYLATRTLKNPKDRLLTLLVIGFFSCSARLPVYVLFVSAFFPMESAGNILFGIYLLGAMLALIAAKILHSALLGGKVEPFVMEMPRYRLPNMKALGRDLKIKTYIFLRRAGLYIGVISFVIWYLGSFPKVQMPTDSQISQESYQMENSYLGRFGLAIEPIFKPLGFDWKMSVASVTALVAKEAAVGTLATLHNVSSDGDTPDETLIDKVRASVDFKAAIAFIVIIMIYSPCLAAMATFFGEVSHWRWRLFYLAYPNLLAWLMAFLAYNVLRVFGF